MTSANVVEYNIYDKDNNEVGIIDKYMCSTWDRLDNINLEVFTIMAYDDGRKNGR
jgi:hypothetical protein